MSVTRKKHVTTRNKVVGHIQEGSKKGGKSWKEVEGKLWEEK
jgi:hypothetical protein